MEWSRATATTRPAGCCPSSTRPGRHAVVLRIWYDPNGNRTQAEEYYQAPEAGPTVVVTVADERGDPMPGIPVYVFDGATYTGFNQTTDKNGQVSITLPEGNYRFRADVEACSSGAATRTTAKSLDAPASMTIPDPVLVFVHDSGGTPKAGLPVYGFEGTTIPAAPAPLMPMERCPCG